MMIDTKALRQKIIGLAVSGKLVPQDPFDEPATVLLERIKQEKSALIKRGKLKATKADLKDKQNCDSSYYKNLPLGWSSAPLRELGTVYGGGTPSKSRKEFWEKGNVPWLTPAEMSSIATIHISNTEKKITGAGLENSSATMIPSNSVIMSSRAPIGYLAINDIPMATSQGCKSFCPINAQYILPEYVYFFLESAKEKINENASGTTFKEISGKEFGELWLPIPPRNEQVRIVKRLSEVLEKIKEIQVAQDQYLVSSKALKDKILTLAIRGRLLKPEKRLGDGEDKNYYRNSKAEWRELKLKSVINLQSGCDLKPSEYSDSKGEIPYITGASNFNDEGSIIINRFTSKKYQNSLSGDILLTCKGTIGKIAFNNIGPCHIARQIMAISTKENTDFLRLFLLTKTGNLIKAGRSQIPGINRSDVLELTICLPSKEIQKKLATLANEVLKLIP